MSTRNCAKSEGKCGQSLLVILRHKTSYFSEVKRISTPVSFLATVLQTPGKCSGIGTTVNSMGIDAIKCVLLADAHHGLSEGIRSLLESEFRAVVMVADETSLLEGAVRLEPSLVVADLGLTRGEAFGWLRRLLARCPAARVIVLSAHDETTVMQGAFDAGAAGFVRRRDIASQLLKAVDAVMAGRRYPPQSEQLRWPMMPRPNQRARE